LLKIPLAAAALARRSQLFLPPVIAPGKPLFTIKTKARQGADVTSSSSFFCSNHSARMSLLIPENLTHALIDSKQNCHRFGKANKKAEVRGQRSAVSGQRSVGGSQRSAVGGQGTAERWNT